MVVGNGLECLKVLGKKRNIVAMFLLLPNHFLYNGNALFALLINPFYLLLPLGIRPLSFMQADS